MSFLTRKRAKEQHAIAVHALVKWKCSRDVCEAYLQGLAFAAFADDEKLDEGERLILNDIGESLGMQPCDIEEAVQTVQAVVDDFDKFESLIKECLSAIKDNEMVVKLFYAQFAQIWISHEHEPQEALVDTLSAIGATEVTGVALPDATLALIRRVLDGGDGLDDDLLSLSEWMGEDALRYFAARQYGDISCLLEKARKQKEVEAEAKRKADVRGKLLATLLKLPFSPFERIAKADKVKLFYRNMRSFVAKYLDKKDVTSSGVLYAMGKELADAGFDIVDPQEAFKEIAVQLLDRVESLSRPAIPPSCSWAVLNRDDRFKETVLIAKETVWIVIGLYVLKFKNEYLPTPTVCEINKIIRRAQQGIKLDSDMHDLWARHTDGVWHALPKTLPSIEDVFVEVLGVEPVWESLFVVTDEQRKMLDDWAERGGRRLGGDKLKEYARSIGMSWVRWCDETTFRNKVESVVLGNTSRD